MKAKKTRDAKKPRDEVLAFIKHFEGARETFLHGCCYWFAHILSERFWLRENVVILYEPVEGHFITQIGERYYAGRHAPRGQRHVPPPDARLPGFHRAGGIAARSR